jgi:hypothetical protein
MEDLMAETKSAKSELGGKVRPSDNTCCRQPRIVDGNKVEMKRMMLTTTLVTVRMGHPDG